ncbi:hypothetical protein [Planosporangium mesophilum]|uniref:Uncharacterized protein n=1 Tax=Planosporangium mesophilum TaxID=689768 RepID=A0A8J3TEM7_9ACTN|nr:hypothetical protein [Planosporangium mesophilum]NJC84472.1 hypothetical protein [Planosporangium mesophilum]GII23384.1 hypothetical protein Pme01_29810 [Planosporangium mesophilum]
MSVDGSLPNRRAIVDEQATVPPDVRVVLVIRPTVIMARAFKPGDPAPTFERSVAGRPA